MIFPVLVVAFDDPAESSLLDTDFHDVVSMPISASGHIDLGQTDLGFLLRAKEHDAIHALWGHWMEVRDGDRKFIVHTVLPKEGTPEGVPEQKGQESLTTLPSRIVAVAYHR